MTDMMLDTETLGRKGGCAVLSIGPATKHHGHHGALVFRPRDGRPSGKSTRFVQVQANSTDCRVVCRRRKHRPQNGRRGAAGSVFISG